MHLFKQYPDSIVSVFLCDHFVLQEDAFAEYVEQAFALVESNPSKIVFLGAKPTDPDPRVWLSASGGTGRPLDLLRAKD